MPDVEGIMLVRPGFVLEVDERTPPLLVHQGEGVLLEQFPLGTRVVYPPESLPGVGDVDAAIAAALAAPVGSEPLAALLRPGMRLTISFDDLSTPLPRMRRPDVRGRIIEAVLTAAAAAGVDDVALVVANGLNRRLSAGEVERIVGERVFRSFWPGQLRSHDAEDPDNLTVVGVTDADEQVEVSRRVAAADLLVHVGVVQSPAAVGAGGLVTGLSSYATLRHVHSVAAAVRRVGLPGDGAGGVGDGGVGAPPGPAARMGRLLCEAVRVFAVAVTVNAATAPVHYPFLTRREWEWSLADQAMAVGLGRGLELVGSRARRRLLRDFAADYAVTSVSAGDPTAVAAVAAAAVDAQQRVTVDGQSDVVVVGLGPFGPFDAGAVVNPVLAAHGALGEVFGRYRGRPVVRENGALIVYHPLTPRFSQLHHPSYVDFYEEVLAESTEAATVEAKFERQYATDPWYASLYRTSLAHHGVHPFHRWYEAAPAMAHVGDVVWVGGDRAACARLGFRAASTLADALEMVSGSVGRDPSITYLHSPPHLIAEVR
ncbi:hypothetical protein ThrDRAFT_03253 [Frankia casuarinae]|nr:hypothetical protein CcI6DRAFT_03219 [Frankia sp. CcI6]EYT91075.1 hypothetical protein ThrDRAFT_03253 [Frankia casuarinae]OAA23095.1 protein of unknown function (DUF2088) [Frankia casuarinae]